MMLLDRTDEEGVAAWLLSRSVAAPFDARLLRAVAAAIDSVAVLDAMPDGPIGAQT
jgi:hypothetical protein